MSPGPLDQYILERSKLKSLQRRRGVNPEEDARASIRKRTQPQAQPEPPTRLNVFNQQAPELDALSSRASAPPPRAFSGPSTAAATTALPMIAAGPPPGGEIAPGTRIPALGAGQPPARQ